MRDFVGKVAEAGCDVFIVHARNAWLKGLSPKENREVPPLRYEVVGLLKRDFPSTTFVVNGGLADERSIADAVERFDGAMIGRAAYHQPWLLAMLDTPEPGRRTPSRATVVAAMAEYCDRAARDGVPLRSIVRHMLGLYHGQPDARTWRRTLSDADLLRGADAALLWRALEAVEPSATPASSNDEGALLRA